MPGLRQSLLAALTRRYPLYSGGIRLANHSVIRRIGGTSNELVWSRVNGGEVLGRLDDLVGRTAFYTGDLDRKISWVCARIVKPRDTVLDIGANIGIVSLWLSKLVGEKGRVHAFEPNPELCKLLEQTIHRNHAVASLRPQTFPNSERLKAQLSDLGNESDGGSCEDCGTLAESTTPTSGGNSGETVSASPVLPAPAGAWTIRTSVDQVTLFFTVSSHGHMVNDLEQSNIRILDDNKPPEKVEQFAPQSKLPLRLALLVDTSGSVRDRFSFEKHAATKFVEKMLNGGSDLGFITGFSEQTTVTQDFSPEPGELGKGIEKLANGGGTALFDAVLFACRKLAAYPENERVARVLVILSDGEDNSSHSSLKQSIQVAERTGVTIYTVSTREDRGDKTDADRVLEMLAERTGGEGMFPGDILTLGKSFDKLHDLIRSRYFVAYKPADFQPNGNYRTISVTAEKEGKRLQVRARKGYHARLAATPN